MSMPSSRLLVATTAGSRPALSSSSIWARCSLVTEPWWARASTAGAPRPAPAWAMTSAGVRVAVGRRRRCPARAPRALRCRASSAAPRQLEPVPDLVEPGGSRSASRRELANTIVERCSATRSTMRSSTCGQIEARCSAPAAAGPAEVAGRLAELGHVLRPGRRPRGPTPCPSGGWTTSTGRPPARKRATSSTGRTVADSPIRWAGRSSSASSRSRRQRQVRPPLGAGHGVHLVDDDGLDTGERLAGRRGEQEEQRLGGRDEDVGRGAGEARAARSAGVSPERTDDGDVGTGQAEPGRGVAGSRRAGSAGCARRRRRAPSSGRRRAPGSVAAAPAGGGSSRQAGPGPRGTPRASCPDPVGATTRACRPELIASQAPAWAGVGAAKLPRNQAAVAGENRPRTSRSAASPVGSAGGSGGIREEEAMTRPSLSPGTDAPGRSSATRPRRRRRPRRRVCRRPRDGGRRWAT